MKGCIGTDPMFLAPATFRLLPLLTWALASGTVVFCHHLPPPPEATHAKTMILGTFHFDDAGLDGYQPKHRLDLLSAKRQQEVAALLDSLGRFRPNKIAVEWSAEQQAALDAEFAKYVAGSEGSLGPNKIYRLGEQFLVWHGCPS